MIEKIIPPTPIHLLDHITIPINVRQSHWFPAHINLQTWSFSLLDSSQDYSVASYPQQKMLIRKFFKIIWTTRVSGETPGPYWAIPPDRFIKLHPRLTNLTLTMTQILRKCPQTHQDEMEQERNTTGIGRIPSRRPAGTEMDSTGAIRDTPAE